MNRLSDFRAAMNQPGLTMNGWVERNLPHFYHGGNRKLLNNIEECRSRLSTVLETMQDHFHSDVMKVFDPVENIHDATIVCRKRNIK